MAFAVPVAIALLSGASGTAGGLGVTTGVGTAAAAAIPYVIAASPYIAAAAGTAGAFITNQYVSGVLGQTIVGAGVEGARRGIIRGLRSRHKPVRAIAKRAIAPWKTLNSPIIKGGLGFITAGKIRGL